MTTEPLFSRDAEVIDGKAAAAVIVEEIRNAVLLEQVTPGLAVVLVGSDPASAVYVRNKANRARECGFFSRQIVLAATTSEDELLKIVSELNLDRAIHGILVQFPLPPQINSQHVIDAIDPEKDVDGFHYANAGRLAVGAAADALVPCTPLGALRLIKQACGPDLGGLHAVILGRSNIVGKQLANLLLLEHCTVSVVHSRTINPENICRQADILVAAVGVPRLVKGSWIKPGAVVIDVGINRVADDTRPGQSHLVGDVDFDEARTVAAAITPVPGGVGPMTIAMLLKNTLSVALRSRP
ncbi:bifunctional methylenetetrahydrofolate dehydrogenase/methenyltetrahydrofolate cyclohydrolase FolD [Paraburkholderia xenovorans]|uniref:bifunctional 5,10-methylenetetrahydrofolate dehydrogenase/5,10-methenyltetrahydrofolate cyclohydrolase n=1 Tax=Paraburkholderia xenovorans TaxID=36873 RepID=UPI0038B948C6